MKFPLCLFILSIQFSAASAQPGVSRFNWLEGTWKRQGSDAYEQWQVVSDTLIAGASFHREEKDYVRDEDIGLLMKEGKMFYVPTVKNQNKGKPVYFEITAYTDTSFIAENPVHDFPQRIGYELISGKYLKAFIEGNRNGKPKRIAFDFEKE
ncbi:MAG: hypothetical protein KIS94_02405 [Chitinophagales bacterium]|nr:hypothetical protein [Chitinophagales bacterium]